MCPLSIKRVIDILKAAKKKYGDIPVAGFNGEGLHIEVMKSDKKLEDLPSEFSWGPPRRISKHEAIHRRKKNPDTKYIWFWD